MAEHSVAWEDGDFAGGSDATAHLDHEEEVRSGGYYANRKPRKLNNPHPYGTAEHIDWRAGYDHGWHAALDHDQQHAKGLR